MLNLFETIFSMSFSVNCFGWHFGLQESVGIGRYPYILAFFTHLHIVPGLTPTYLATCLIPQPLRTKSAASLRTFGRYGFFVYDICIYFNKCFQAIEP